MVHQIKSTNTVSLKHIFFHRYCTINHYLIYNKSSTTNLNIDEFNSSIDTKAGKYHNKIYFHKPILST